MVKITFKCPSIPEPFLLDIDPSVVQTIAQLKKRVG
jgi:hypothetical protein